MASYLHHYIIHSDILDDVLFQRLIEIFYTLSSLEIYSYFTVVDMISR